MIDRKTVNAKGEYGTEIKHSRFIGCAFPVRTVEEAEKIIETVRSENRKAKHVVYAYIIGNNTGYSDDGEPKKTAGLPIYTFLSKEGYNNVLVTVVRYFGGILLGTGGLVKAYTDAAKGAVADAGDRTETQCDLYEIEDEYNAVSKLKNLCEKYAVTTEIEYGVSVKLKVYVKQQDAERLKNDCSELLKGKTPKYIMNTEI